MDYFNQPLADSLDDQKRKQDGSTNNDGTNPFGESDQSSSSLFGSDNTSSQPEIIKQQWDTYKVRLRAQKILLIKQ